LTEIKNISTKVITFLNKRQNEDTSTVDIGIHMSILELHLMAENILEFDKYSCFLEDQELINYTAIHEYLKILNNIRKGNYSKLDQSRLTRIILQTGYKNDKWNCKLISYWEKKFEIEL